MLAADLLAQFLLAEFEKNSSLTIVFWSDKWRLSIDELVCLLRGDQSLSRKHQHIWGDVSFTRADYAAAENGTCGPRLRFSNTEAFDSCA
jgi:hypothetical protein